MMVKINDIREKYAAYKYLAVSLFGVMLLLATVSFVVWPFYEKHLSLEQESKALQQKLQILEQFASKHPHYEEEHNKREAAIAKLEQQLPTSVEGFDIMTHVQKVAKSSGVMLSASRIMNAKNKDDKLVSTGVDIKAQGSYAAILKFLENLDQNSLTGIEQLHMESVNEGMLRLSGKYYVYGLKDKL